MNKIIIISGKQYSGKDTLAKILLEELSDFKRIGIGDAIKIEYGKMKNLTFEEIEKNKHLFISAYACIIKRIASVFNIQSNSAEI